MGRTWPLVLAMLGACGRIGFDGPTASGGDSAPSNDASSDASSSGIAFVGSPIQHTGTMGATDTATFNATSAGDPPNTVEQVAFANPNGYVVVAATIKPIP
jgi:hypothetical protein